MNITEKSVEKLQASAERQNSRDDAQTGFGIRVEAESTGGRKSFFWNAKVGGHVIFKSLGEWPTVSVKAARDAARELTGKAATWKQAGCPEDQNPFTKKQKILSTVGGAPTFAELIERYVELHLHDPKAEINDPVKAEKNLRWAIGKYFRDWHEKRVDQITVEDVIKLRDSAGNKQYMANRLVQYARGLLAWCGASKDGRVNMWPLPTNVATRVSLFQEHKRDRYLSPSELVAFIAALEDKQTPRDLADFVRVALKTGARKSNVLAMKWTDIDFDLKDWHVPMSKSGEGYHVDLTLAALTTLERRRKEVATSSPFVFPAHSAKSGHLCDVHKPWQRFLKRLHLPQDLRIHDLRRTCGSYQAIAGVSLQKIGATLGHKALGSTNIYARLHAQAVSEARAAGESKMQEMMEQARKRLKLQARTPARQKLLTTAGVARG
jgi:integrase